MSAALAAAPPMRAPTGPTLAGVLHEAWSDFTAGEHAECPVCSGPMRPRWSATARVVGGRCEDCGTTLE